MAICPLEVMRCFTSMVLCLPYLVKRSVFPFLDLSDWSAWSCLLVEA